MCSHSPNTRTFPMHIQPLLVLRVKKKLRAKTTKIVRSYPRLRIERVPIDDIVPFEMYFSTACALTTQKKSQKIAAYLRSLFRFCDELLLCDVSLFFSSKKKEDKRGEGQISISYVASSVKKKRKNEKNKIVTHFSLFSLRRVLREHGTHLRRRGE